MIIVDGSVKKIHYVFITCTATKCDVLADNIIMMHTVGDCVYNNNNTYKSRRNAILLLLSYTMICSVALCLRRREFGIA